PSENSPSNVLSSIRSKPSAASASGEIALVGDLQLGASQAQAEAADGFDLIEESTLDGEFSLGDKIGGFLEEEEVSMLYAGTQCFFR
ncbi:MAG: hypothetical protein AAGK01_11350, partial [Pseudomonadota bacterium]